VTRPLRAAATAATLPLRASKVAADGWRGYAASAWRRRASAGQVSKELALWARTVTQHRKPWWAHPHTVVRTWPFARLLDYSNGAAAEGVVPTLVLPPQAGHASTVVDHAHGQSQMVTLRDAGLTSLYTFDWLPATRATADVGIEDYLTAMDETIDSLGGRVNLVGDCQGGWLSAIYAGLHPDKVNTLTVAGAPIDTHAGGGVAAAYSRRVPAWLQEAVYRATITVEGGLHRGDSQLAFFKSLEPLASLQRSMGLLPRIHDEDFVARYVEFTDWYEYTQDMPGNFYLWAVIHLFVRNELVSGEMVIGGKRVDLGRITCPVFLITGIRDHITPEKQVWALGDRVSTPKEQIFSDRIDAGHLGVFIGRSALEDHWAPLMRQVAAYSQPDIERKASPARAARARAIKPANVTSAPA
jgi:poly(3-hydroxybutyrate) depolymerase